MRRRNAWIGAVAIALVGAWLAAGSRPTDAPAPAKPSAERPATPRVEESSSDGMPTQAPAARKASEPALGARRPKVADGGVGPEVPSPRAGLLTPERQALLASGRGPRLRRIEDSVRVLEQAVANAERAGDRESAAALRRRIEALRKHEAEMIRDLPPQPVTPEPELLQPLPPVPTPAPE